MAVAPIAPDVKSAAVKTLSASLIAAYMVLGGGDWAIDVKPARNRSAAGSGERKGLCRVVVGDSDHGPWIGLAARNTGESGRGVGVGWVVVIFADDGERAPVTEADLQKGPSSRSGLDPRAGEGGRIATRQAQIGNLPIGPRPGPPMREPADVRPQRPAMRR